jgi:hypothetical protein
MTGRSLILTVNTMSCDPVMSNDLTNIYQTLMDHTKYFDIIGFLPLMLCTAEMTYEYELYCRHKNSVNRNST